jgi:glycerol-3-phosphate O-acyltransferase
MPRAAIVAEAGRLRTALAAQGAHVHLPRDDPDYEVTVGLRGLVARGVLRETAEGYEVALGEDALLRFYANSVLQLVHRDRAPSAAT